MKQETLKKVQDKLTAVLSMVTDIQTLIAEDLTHPEPERRWVVELIDYEGYPERWIPSRNFGILPYYLSREEACIAMRTYGSESILAQNGYRVRQLS